jgi:hypothetical protein
MFICLIAIVSIASLLFSDNYAHAPCRSRDRHVEMDSAKSAEATMNHFKKLSDSINKLKKKNRK